MGVWVDGNAANNNWCNAHTDAIPAISGSCFDLHANHCALLAVFKSGNNIYW